MDDDNVATVSWCLQTSRQEKLARLAAKKLFGMINPTTKSAADRLTKDEFVEGLGKLACDKKEKKLLEKAGAWLQTKDPVRIVVTPTLTPV